MPYVPGDNWIICDLTGRKVLMSQSRKTWDGLRVWEKVWYPKHPQLYLRAIPDHMAVIDGRSRPTDIYMILQYGYGSFCLTSPNGTHWTFYVDDDGALLPANITWGNPVQYLYIDSYRLHVDNDGALHVESSGGIQTAVAWKMRSYGDFIYDLIVDTDLALLVIPSTWYS
jgi:hypothetical protein